MAELASEQGNFAAGRAYQEEELAVLRAAGIGGRRRSAALNNLGGHLLEQGDLDGAEALYREAREATRVEGPKDHEAGNVLNLALVAQRRGDTAAMAALAREGRALAAESGSDFHLLYAEGMVGAAELALGNLDAADSFFMAWLRLSRRLGIRKQAAMALGSMSSTAYRRGDLPRAARLRAAADALYERLGTPIYGGDTGESAEIRAAVRAARAARAAGPGCGLAAAWDEGAAWDEEAAAAFALGGPAAAATAATGVSSTGGA